MLIITGDTKVVDKGKGDKIFINTTGFGELHPKANISVHNIKEGDIILVNGYIAQHGMAIMSERKGLEFESTILSDTTNLNFLVKDLLDQFGDKIKLFRDPTRGGLGTVLHEIANDISKGVKIVLSYDHRKSAFIGSAENMTSKTIENISIRVILSSGLSLEPTV